MWEPLQRQFLTPSLKISTALLRFGEGLLFIVPRNFNFKKENVLKSYDFRTFGGDKRDRTADLLNAIQALSQLSYTPIFSCCFGSWPQRRTYNTRYPLTCQA